MGTQTRQENIFAWSEFNFIKNATLSDQKEINWLSRKICQTQKMMNFVNILINLFKKINVNNWTENILWYARSKRPS